MGARLVGRDRELELLGQALADAEAGTGRAVLVSGEPGIGKSALLEAWAREVGGRARVAVGRSSSVAAPPFWTWRQVLGVLVPAVEPPWTAAAAGARETVFAAVVDLLARAVEEGPPVVVVEDLHWADGSSLALLRFVIDALPGLAAVVVMTAREPLEPGAATEAVDDLPAAVVRVPLSGLDQNATGAIVRQVLGPAVDDGTIATIHARTGGNPFFVGEVARLRALQGRRASDVVPPGVRQVLGRRLARLPQRVVGVLTMAAVCEDFDTALLAQLTGHPQSEVGEQLDQAVRAQLVRRGAAGLELAHALVREVLLEDLGGRLAGLHRQAALALSERAGPPPHAALAFHWARADGDDADAQAAGHGLAAARQAVRETAYEQALPLYELALRGADPASDALAVGVEAGEAQILAGDLPGGRDRLRVAARAALEEDQPDVAGRAVLAMGGGPGGFEVDQSDTEQAALLRRVLAALPEADQDLRAALLARLSLVAAWSTDVASRVALTTEALALCGPATPATVRVAVLAAYCDAVAGPDGVAERHAAATEMLGLAETSGDLRLVLLARRLRVVACLERGDLAGADADIAAYERTARMLDVPLYTWPVPVWRGMRALLDGDVAAAFAWIERAEAVQLLARSGNADAMVFTLRHAALRAAGDHAASLPALEELLLAYAGYRGVECFMAGAFAEAGRLDRARALLDRQVAAGLDTLDRDSEFLEFVWQAGTAAILLGDQAAMRSAYEVLEPYADLWAVDGIGAAVFGVVAQQLGVLARHLGDRAAARRWLEAALARHREAGAPALVVATEAELAAIGAQRAPSPAPEPARFVREGAAWRVAWRGAEAVVADSKGMHDLATLLVRPGVEVDVLDLVGRDRAVRDAGDAGPVLDAAAKRAYRQRLAELDEDIADAEADADLGRLAARREERDLLFHELSASLGLGGRSRRLGDQRERARKAVGMRLRTALDAIAAAHPSLGRHLRNSISTGGLCSYQPEQPVTWATS